MKSVKEMSLDEMRALEEWVDHSVSDKNLTVADKRALLKLANCSTWVRPQQFGEMLWPSQKSRTGSAPLARSAGKVLNRLKAAGLAIYIPEQCGWIATYTGLGEAQIIMAEDRRKI